MSNPQQAPVRRGQAAASAQGAAAEGARRRLTEDEIVEAALALARRVGIRSLTMRGLAEELGVTPMAAYYHVPSKQALMDLVANSVLARAEMPGPEAGEWDDRLWEFISQNIRELAKYPGLGEYLETSRTPAGRGQVDQSLVVLEGAGFSTDEARMIYSAIYAYMFGRVALQSLLNQKGEKQRRSRRGSVNALPLADLASAEHIEFGYRALTAGIKAMLQPSRSSDGAKRGSA